MDRSTRYLATILLLVLALVVACATSELAPPDLPKKPAQHEDFQLLDPSPVKQRKPSKYDQFQITRFSPGQFTAESGILLVGGSTANLIICSWNIKWFGRSQPTKYDFVTMADFVEECDVVAIQEVQGPNHSAVIGALLTELSNRGHSYSQKISSNTGYQSNPEAGKNDYLERYAYVWDTNRVSLKDTPAFISSPEINNSTYRQVPYVADFEIKNANGFDFRVLSTHAVYKRSLNAVRKGEIQAIHNWITTLPADTEENLIAIGDFNANPSSQPRHFESIVKTNPLYRILWYESAAAGETSIRTTVPTKDSSTDPDYFRLPVYDHALISSETSYALPADPMTLGGNQFGVYEFDNDPWWNANGWSRSDIIAAVSDHRPIWFRVLLNADDRD